MTTVDEKIIRLDEEITQCDEKRATKLAVKVKFDAKFATFDAKSAQKRDGSDGFLVQRPRPDVLPRGAAPDLPGRLDRR